MKRMLITGFEPFGGNVLNSSWEAVTSLSDKIGDYTLTKLCIPVVFGKAADMVIDKAEEISADAVICVGQAGGRNKITPELCAVNLRCARIPDNDGASPQNKKIYDDGDDELYSTFNAENLASAVNARGVPAEISHDAGRYVCNDVLYSVLHHFRGTDTVAGFIHVPYSDGQVTDEKTSMPLCDIVLGLTAAIEAM